MAQGLIKAVSSAARKQRLMQNDLMADMAARAEEISRRKERERRRNLKDHLTSLNRTAARVGLALQGIDALSAIGKSRQLQELLKARGKSLRVWGGEHTSTAGYDMADVHWRWVSFIELTTDALIVHNYHAISGDYGTTFKIEHFVGNPPPLVYFPHAVEDRLLRTRPLWRIATANAIEEEDEDDPAWVEKDREDVNFLYSTELLFEILVSCADPKKFKKLIRDAISHE
jgi:hypothetical protein